MCRISTVPTWSIVIPAKNEARLIGTIISRLREVTCSNTCYEIIVVDNGSTDGTPELAENAGARVTRSASSTVGGARNLGAEIAEGEILVFLDADMHVDEGFATQLEVVSKKLRQGSLGIIGGSFRAPADSTWVDRQWFDPHRISEGHSHVASGLMIITKRLFVELGGFNSRLVSGEDYDLSRRVVATGRALEVCPELSAVHLGGPIDTGDFYRREVWHGMKSNIKEAFGKVEMAALVFGILHLVLLLGILLDLPFFVPFGVGGVTVLVGWSTIRRFGSLEVKPLVLFYIYFWARLEGLVRRVLGAPPRSRRPRFGAS